LSEPTRKTAVVGVGNLLMADDGIGVRAIWALKRQSLPDGIELLDGGTAFPTLAGQLAGFQKLIIVDAVRAGAPPGTILKFGLEEILRMDCIRHAKRQIKAPSRSPGALSLHDVGVIEALMLERLAFHTSPGRAADAWNSVLFIGIEPDKVELSMELSPTLKERLPVLVQTILEECTRPDVLYPQEEPS
jgi:hydrogenase maturation protease